MTDDERAPQHADAVAPAAAVYEPEPLPDDTGQYGVYSDHQRSQQGPADEGQPQQQPQYAAYDPYADPSAYGAQDQGAYAGQDPLTGQYDYGTEQQQYAAYSDPYIGTGTTGGSPQYDAYDSYGNGNGYDSFGGRQQYTDDPYAQQYAPRRRPAVSGCPSSARASSTPSHRRNSPRSPPRSPTATTTATATTSSSTATDDGRRHRSATGDGRAAGAPTGPPGHCEPRKPSPSTISPATSVPDMPAWASPPPGWDQPPAA